MQRYFAYHLANGRAAAARVGLLPLGRRARERALAVQPHRRCVAARPGAAARSRGPTGGHFAEFPFKAKTTSEQLGVKRGRTLPDRAMRAHGVNNAMALKTTALWSLVSGEAADRDAATARSTCSTATMGSRTGCSAPTSTMPARIRRRASSSVRSSRRCSRCSTSSPSPVTRRSPTAWSASPSTRCPRRSRPTCGRTSTTSSRTR